MFYNNFSILYGAIKLIVLIEFNTLNVTWFLLCMKCVHVVLSQGIERHKFFLWTKPYFKVI